MDNIKDSNTDWIGKIPTNWEIQPLSMFFEERKEKVSDKDYEPLSVTKNGVVKQLENVAKSDAHDDRKKVCKNDFVINSRSDRKQSCGLSNYDGSVSLINIVLKIDKEKILPEYVKYLFDNCMFAEEFYRNGHGIVADLWTTNFSDMKRIAIPIPPIHEQEIIAKTLDEKILKLNKALNNLNDQIEILNNYLKSKITELITKGINTHTEMKESNVKWIGKIPKHWSVNKIKYLASSLSKGNGITKDDVVTDGDIQCIRYGEIYSKYDNTFSNSFSFTKMERIEKPVFIYSGDILFAGTGELVEEIGKNILYEGKEKCLVGGDIIIMKHNQNAKFLNYALNSISSQEQKSKGKAKLKVVHISASDIGNILIAVPPLKEQKEIAEYLDVMYQKIKEIIKNKKVQIEKLENYKKSIIYEYATGKKRVKGV